MTITNLFVMSLEMNEIDFIFSIGLLFNSLESDTYFVYVIVIITPDFATEQKRIGDGRTVKAKHIIFTYTFGYGISNINIT